MNKNYEKSFKIKRCDFIGKKLSEVIGEDAASFGHPYFLKAVAGIPQTFEYESKTEARFEKNKILQINYIPDFDADGKTKGIVIVANDLTDILKNKKELEQQKSEIQRYIDGVPGWLSAWDKNLRLTKINKTMADELCGKPSSELIGKLHHEIFGEAVSARSRSSFMSCLAGNSINFNDMVEVVDGSIQHYNITYKPQFVDGVVQGVQVVAVNITKYMETEILFEEAQRAAKIGSFYYELETQTSRWSNQLYLLFGLDIIQNPIKIETCKELVHLDDRVYVNDQIRSVIKSGKKICMRFRSVELNNDYSWFELRGEVQKNKIGRVIGLRGTCQDVTDLVLAEEKAKTERAKSIQNSKLASLGEMSAGVAHEINNPLAIISANIEMANFLINEPDKLIFKLDSMENATQRIVKIVSGLKKFSRTAGRGEHKKQLVLDIIKDSLNYTDAKAKRNSVLIELEEQSNYSILCDEIEIQQVLVNLINNAIDAIEKQEEKWVKLKTFERDQQIVVQIRDSGKGIPIEIQKKMFQPFYTTKEVGKGTGIGLSIVKGILDEHSATITILNKEPNTCFEICFNKIEEIKNVA